MKKYLNSVAILCVGGALLFSATSSTKASGSALPTKLGTPEEQELTREWNERHSLKQNDFAEPVFPSTMRPFSELEETAYVAISGGDDFELADLRLAIAKNLPQEATLIVYITEVSQAVGIKQALGKDLGPRLKFLTVPLGFNKIWARDSLPYPVWLKPTQKSPARFALIGSLYFSEFKPSEAVANAFDAPIFETNLYFRGGNMLSTLDGECFSEDASEVHNLGTGAESFFKNWFGCKTFTLLEHRSGIGDIDERIKFLPGKRVLTDEPAYAELLKKRGFDVHMIPRVPNGGYETYMNTLYVNGTIFVPQMNQKESDAAALAAYRAEGFKPVPVTTKTMADEGQGNIHCVTMNYPKSAFRGDPKHGSDFMEFDVR